MRRIENDCCDCAVPGYPCIGDACGLTHVEHFYCDKCGDEEELYYYNDQELCIECIKEMLEKVE